MRSTLHKVLHPLVGRPLIRRVLDLAQQVGANHTIVVLGHQAEQVRQHLPAHVRTVVQEPPLGTGHAVQVAAEALRALETERILVLYGDVALVRPESLRRLLRAPLGPDAPLALLTARVVNPRGYGRVIRAADRTVSALVEEAEASDTEREVDEINSGVMLLWSPWVWERLGSLPEHSKGEFYLTDLVNIARAEGRSVLAESTVDESEVHGVNDRQQLAEAHAIAWQRKRAALMASGVTLTDPDRTYVDTEVEVAADVVIHPGCHLRGQTSIAAGCTIGPDSEIVDSTIGEGSRVWRSVLEGATVGREVQVGPFSHLRPGARIEDRVKLGNYAEVKNSRIGADSDMHHFSYVGDSDFGERVNVGAGTITANFDGQNKHRTIVGNDVKIGSDTIFRAPVQVGDGAVTGAGAVVTRDVAPGDTVTGVPARPLRPKSQSAPTVDEGTVP